MQSISCRMSVYQVYLKNDDMDVYGLSRSRVRNTAEYNILVYE